MWRKERSLKTLPKVQGNQEPMHQSCHRRDTVIQGECEGEWQTQQRSHKWSLKDIHPLDLITKLSLVTSSKADLLQSWGKIMNSKWESTDNKGKTTGGKDGGTGKLCTTNSESCTFSVNLRFSVKASGTAALRHSPHPYPSKTLSSSPNVLHLVLSSKKPPNL